MKVIGKDRTSCDVCNPIDEILARLDALERRASAIVAKVQGIAPDGEGNVALPTSSSDTDPLHGRVDAFAMSSEVKEAADDAHAYAASIADDVVVINSEINALNQAVEALQPAEIEAIKSAVQTLQATVTTLESTVATLNNSVAGKVSKSGDTMSGNLTVQNDSVRELTLKNTSISKSYERYKQVGIINGNASDGVIGKIEILRNTPLGFLGSGVIISAYNSTGTQQALSIYSFDDGVNQEAYVQHPSWKVGTNDNSDKSLTIKMANSLPSLVHTTGNETIAGSKRFSQGLIRQHSAISAGSVPTSDQYVPIVNVQDSSGTDFGYIRMFAGANSKLRLLQIQINKLNDDGSTPENSFLQLFAEDENGPARATAPTTPSGATGTEIATANWVLTKINELATKNGLNGL